MSFCTVINCMDGRVQLPVNEYMVNKYHVTFVDTITEPGPVGLLADQSNPHVIESIKTRTNISIDKHSSTIIAVVGHHDCAGNPVPKDIQRDQISESARYLQTLYPHCKVIGLWVNDLWLVEEV